MEQPTSFSVWRILLIILLEGFVTISVEILSIRQLIPVVGNSILVTSLIIGVFLLFLAYGYQAGGRQSQDLLACLRRNFFIAAIGIGVGVSFLFIELFFLLLNIHLHVPLLVTLLLYLLCIVAPIVYFLGQTVPITMNLIYQQQSVGALGGKVLHLSTIGSFLGAVLTTVLLMNFLGVAWTVIINFAVLAALIVLIGGAERKIILLSSLVLFAGITFWVNRAPEISLIIASTPYANYMVSDNVTLDDGRKGKLLSVNNSYSSFIDAQGKGLKYIEFIKNILFHQLMIQNKDILVLGAGGFTLSAQNTFGNRFTYVDIDPAIYKIVQKNFQAHVQGQFIAADARLYVKEHPQGFDVIVSDTYSNKYTIPNQLLTREYFASVKQALRPDGIVIFNIIASPLLNTPYAKRVDNTIRAVFSSCTASPVEFSAHRPANIIYVCQNNKESDDSLVYDDDLNRASLDFFVQ